MIKHTPSNNIIALKNEKRCKAITIKGERCMRRTWTKNSKLCLVHLKGYIKRKTQPQEHYTIIKLDKKP